MFDPEIVRELDEWSGMGVYTRRVPALDAWIFCALHDERLGRPTGGTRIRLYPRPEDGLRDALRLAQGMTFKWAAVELPFGGGKAVLCLSRELAPRERELLLREYARALNVLRDSFGTGQDLGSTPEDMRFLGSLCHNVHGLDPKSGEVEDPGPHTALGVHTAIRAAVAHHTGYASLERAEIVVEGVGDVGEPLARMLADDGARLVLVDTDRDKARRLAKTLGARTEEPGNHHALPCDVFVPCAVGATLNAETIPELSCRIVCGSANNQLRTADDATRLHERGILYAPDFIANAGGAAYCSGLGTGVPREELRERVLHIGTILTEVLEEAAGREESPLHAAKRRVRRTLERG